MKHFSTIAVALSLLWLAASAWADEVDDLVASIKPPARFAVCTPDFWVKEGRIAFDTHVGEGIEQGPCWYIMDGNRYVALYQPSIGRIDLIAVDPLSAPTTLPLPARYHRQTYFGSTFNGALYGAHVDKAPASFKGGGATL
jgi:hypothetical protein